MNTKENNYYLRKIMNTKENNEYWTCLTTVQADEACIIKKSSYYYTSYHY